MNLDEMTAGLSKTELVYLREMKLSEIKANVVKVVPEKRTHAYLMLDRTIFHPKGGGQPSDRGLITSPQFVLNVKKAIYHGEIVVHWGKIASGSPALGPVSCQIDWGYRYMLTRRHTAAHLLDHCLAEATSMRIETTDSWLEEPCYVGYKGKAPDSEVLKKVEELANTMISAGGTVAIKFLTAEEGKSLLQNAPNFERLPDVREVRIVTIAGCHPIPCGGSHVADINEIRKLSVVRAEQIPDMSFRLHFSIQD